MSTSPFGFDTPEDSPGFLLWQTTISWQRLIKKALETYHISHAQFVIIALLLWHQNQDQDMTQMDIARLSKLDKMTVSKSLKKLTGMNIVTRHENPTDNRAKSVQLTKKGIDLARTLVPIVEDIDTTFFNTLTKAQEKDLISLLLKLTPA